MRRAAIALTLALGAACGGGGGGVDSGPAQPIQVASADPAAGCGAVVRFPEGTRKHVDAGERVEYATEPPVSGDHEKIWAATGTYSKEIPNEIQVHNLEHGHVLIQYVPGEVEPAVLDGLIALVRANPKWTILAPRSAARFVPAAALSFTAWTVLRTCETPAAGAVAAAESFVRSYGKKAPETVPGQPIAEPPPR